MSTKAAVDLVERRHQAAASLTIEQGEWGGLAAAGILSLFSKPPPALSGIRADARFATVSRLKMQSFHLLKPVGVALPRRLTLQQSGRAGSVSV